jgi:hypothetical protein
LDLLEGVKTDACTGSTGISAADAKKPQKTEFTSSGCTGTGTDTDIVNQVPVI